MRTISACIITDNNPKVLNAIESVYNSVDEIILVNTNGDFTHDISKLDKVKLFHFEWTKNFSEARNYSISKATGDYILIIVSCNLFLYKIFPLFLKTLAFQYGVSALNIWSK